MPKIGLGETRAPSDLATNGQVDTFPGSIPLRDDDECVTDE